MNLKDLRNAKEEERENPEYGDLVSPPLELTHRSSLALDLDVSCRNLSYRMASSPGPWSVIHREMGSLLW